MGTVITIVNYNCTVITIINYDPKTFIVQATGLTFVIKAVTLMVFCFKWSFMPFPEIYD